MNEIKPFCGWRYNPQKVDLSRVMAPPYDIVGLGEQEDYLNKSPHNVFHLELGRIFETDDEGHNRYTRARELWQRWRKEGVLLKEPVPALYLYRLHFSWQGQDLVRRGLIALVRLAPWESRLIRPHEKTFARVTEDRLKLLRATQAQFSQIFCLYHDPALRSFQFLEQGAENLYYVTDPQGFRHELARITQQDLIKSVSELVAQGPFYIADGHHRYTTALAYMQEMQSRYGAEPPRCFHYVMMYLCPFEDPGLLVLPTHRLLKLEMGIEALKEALAPWGVLEPLEQGREALPKALTDLPSGAFFVVSQERLWRFQPHHQGLEQLRMPLPPALKDLPVALFTTLLQAALRLEEARLKEEGRLLYTPWIEEVWQKAKDAWMGFLLPPTPVTALEDVADAGLVMPHKSTFFFPKILTGMVFFELRPEVGPPC